MKTVVKTLMASLALLLAFSPLFGQVPMYMNYQGRLTNDLGEPITNTSPGIQMTFTVWDDETLSDPANEEWSSGSVYVPVENGFFDYQLGPFSVGLLADLLTSTDHWLGVKIESDAEISPRSKLASVPYAVHAATVQDVYVNEAGDVMSGDLLFDGQNNGETDGKIIVGDDHADIELFQSQFLTAKLWGWEYGELDLYYYSDDYLRAALVGTIDGGMLTLRDDADADKIVLDAGETGDLSVFLPEDAINSGEILNEPGIAQSIKTSSVPLNDAGMTDILAVSITIPTDGFIWLAGRCTIDFSSSTANYAFVQIDEVSGGGLEAGYYTEAGYNNASGLYFPVYVDRVYFKSAGTYTFRLEGMLLPYTGSSGDAAVNSITAMFFPTSYAAVKGISSSPGDDPDAKAITTYNPLTGENETVYETDLRYYEIRSKEAEMKALKAKLDLRQAEMKAARENERTGEVK